jgi:hypothetical protein
MKRIITCQGSVQFVTALSVLIKREEEQSGESYENYLVIYDLYAPGGQNDQFAAFLKTMAASVYEWNQISYVTPEQLNTIVQQLASSSPKAIFQAVHEWVGTAVADEIYLCRNWQFGSQLLINAYQTATKICYGDGIGLYFSETSPIIGYGAKPSSMSWTIPPLPIRFRLWAAVEWHRWKERLGFKTVLKDVPFDVGYFVLPNIMGEEPPMPYTLVDRGHLLSVFQQFSNLLHAEWIEQLRSSVAERSIVVLLTSNFSEAGRLSADQEIEAYRKLLLSQTITPDAVLIIKPHPRDDTAKIQNLKTALSDRFSQIITLTHPELFFLPFEVFFQTVLHRAQSNAEIQVVAVSSACLSLKLLFETPSTIGFGDAVVKMFFKPDQIDDRLEVERMLRKALSHIKA